MKINRFIVLAVIALLVVGAMGFVTARGLAFVSASLQKQAQVTEAPDTDNIEEQDGDQNEAENGPEVEDRDQAGESQDQENEGPDGDPDQAALQPQARITAEQAQQAALAANPGATVLETELDNETGALIYSVELDNGQSVEVDAGTGQILKTEPAD